VTLRVVPVTRDEARRFVRQHHRHNAPLPVEVMRAGLADGGQLVGVAVAGLPARMLMDGVSLEVTRVCTVGHRNACSMLYGAIARAAKALGWRRLYTYTLASEPGASVRAAGFVEDGRVPAREYLSKTHRPRYAENLFGERAVPEEEKIRWRRDL
jgi:hypothetical protein